MSDEEGVPTADARKGMRRIRSTLTPSAKPRPAAMRLHRPNAPSVEVALDEDRKYVVGRHEAAEVVFDSPKVSAVHGVLAFDAEDRWVFSDTGSSNGSVIKKGVVDVKLAAGDRAPVDVGDVIVIGDRECRIEMLMALAARGTETTVRRSAAAQAFDEKITLAAKTNVPVFLLGASGTGKTVTAKELHRRGGTKGAFVVVSCARLPSDPSALQSELLGHRKGAFTGASTDHEGRLFAADGGTLFLDEVESLGSLGQGFLLDVLEGTGDAIPLGAEPNKGVDAPSFRLISASKVPLLASGLRADLCERLGAGHMLSLPTLEERRDDIPWLIAGFLDEARRLIGADVAITDDAVALAASSPWPGQLRQLRATVATLAQLAVARVGGAGSDRALIRRDDLAEHLDARARTFATAREAAPPLATATLTPPSITPAEKRDARVLTDAEVRAALARNNFNQAATARELGIARNTLIKKMRDFRIVSSGGAVSSPSPARAEPDAGPPPESLPPVDSEPT